MVYYNPLIAVQHNPLYNPKQLGTLFSLLRCGTPSFPPFHSTTSRYCSQVAAQVDPRLSFFWRGRCFWPRFSQLQFSKVVSAHRTGTHPCRNLYQQAIYGIPFIVGQGDCLGCAPGVCCNFLGNSAWWLNQPIRKNMFVRMGSSSPNRAENKQKYLKPPPRSTLLPILCKQ